MSNWKAISTMVRDLHNQLGACCIPLSESYPLPLGGRLELKPNPRRRQGRQVVVKDIRAFLWENRKEIKAERLCVWTAYHFPTDSSFIGLGLVKEGSNAASGSSPETGQSSNL